MGEIQTAGNVIYEDEHVYVGHIDKNDQPFYLGHIMIDLKRHVPTLAEMSEEEAKTFGVIMAKVSKALKESEGAEHVYALVAGNNVPHLHMHLVARYPETPEQYWGPMAVYDWEDAPKGTNDDVVELCERIKKHIVSGNIHAGI